MITRQEVETGIVSKSEVHRFTAFASDLRDHGFVAGRWPEIVATSLGNGQSFVKSHMEIDDGGDLQWVTYCQLLGCISLRIFND